MNLRDVGSKTSVNDYIYIYIETTMIYTGTLIVPPSFDTVHNFLSQITKFVVTVCSTNVHLYIYCCFVLHVEHYMLISIEG
jgi:hypothetical protein